MEAFPSKFTKAVRSHWKKRKYQRLEQDRKGTKLVTRLGDGPNRRRTSRFFKLRCMFKLRIKILSPIKMLARLRDAYVNAMLGIASKGGGLSAQNGPDAFWNRRIPQSRSTKLKAGEFEKRLVAEIYKSLVASGEIVSMLRRREEMELHAD